MLILITGGTYDLKLLCNNTSCQILLLNGVLAVPFPVGVVLVIKSSSSLVLFDQQCILSTAQTSYECSSLGSRHSLSEIVPN